MLKELRETVDPGVKESTEKIGAERQGTVPANSNQVAWQMDIVEFNRNGCLINGN